MPLTLVLIKGLLCAAYYWRIRHSLRASSRLIFLMLLGNDIVVRLLLTGYPVRGTAMGHVDQRIYALAIGGSLFALASIIALKDLGSGRLQRYKVRFGYEHVLVALLLVSVTSAVIGLVMGSAVTYLLSDTYNIVLLPVAYFLTVRLVQEEDAFPFIKAFYGLQAILLPFYLGQQVFDLLSPGISELEAGSRYIFPLLFLSLLENQQKDFVLGLSAAKRRLLLLIALLNVFLSFSRGEWIITIFGLVLTLLIGQKRFVIPETIRGVVLLSSIAVLFSLSAALPESKVWMEPALRLERYARLKVAGAMGDWRTAVQLSSPAVRATGSFDQKTAEIMDVWEHMRREGNLLNILVGMGSGAEWLPIRARPTEVSRGQEGLDHSIHNLVAAKFFRYGAFGLAVVLALFGFITLEFYRALRIAEGNQQLLYAVFLVVFLMLLLRQLSTDFILRDVNFAVYLAVHGRLLRQLQQKRQNAPRRSGIGSKRWVDDVTSIECSS
jgi:hypothetical protein